jgi:nicotinamide phosphoribosyltransferase
MNFITATDSYKFGHHKMLPANTTYIRSYFESRAEGEEIMFFGLQPFLHRLANTRITKEDLEEAIRDSKEHFMQDGVINVKMWQHIIDKHKGKLPLHIRAVKEGGVYKSGIPLITVTNTDPECASLVNHIETLLTHVWFPTNVATIGHNLKNVFRGYIENTCDNMDSLDFMLHDFGMRGTSSLESALIGGAAHLVNFKGTDTFPAIKFIKDNYGYDSFPGFSVYATEHAIMTAKGRSGELDVVADLLKQFPEGILSVVSDSYDIFKLCEAYGTVFKDTIMERNGKFVVRPDSGDPVETTLKCLDILERKFGSIQNTQGFIELPPKIGMIWGDGIGPNGIGEVLDALYIDGWAANNLIYGMGGRLLQKHNRNTYKFAFKSCQITYDGVEHDIFKDPLAGGKTSKKGNVQPEDYGVEARTVFYNGDVVDPLTFEQVRNAN